MAHILDRICFTALTAAAAFAIALNTTNSLPLAMIAGLIAPHPLRYLAQWMRKRLAKSPFCLRRSRRRQATETVRCWAVLRDNDCRKDILSLMQAAYPASAPQLRFAEDARESDIPVYTMLTLRPVSEDAMADCLRRIREGEHARAAIVATHEISSEARALAMLPGSAAIALIDGDMLSALLARHPQAAEFRQLPRVRPARPTLSRAHALKMIPVALFLLAVYWLFGLPMYLPAAMLLTWGILMLLKKRPAPKALF